MEPRERPKAVSSAVRDSWDRCAEAYVYGFGALVSKATRPLLDAATVQSNSIVLDVGTGPGLVAAAAHDRQATAIGIDFFDIHVGRGETTLSPKSNSDMPMRKPSRSRHARSMLSSAISCSIFWPARLRALDEAYRVLRDGGKIALTVWSDLSKLVGFGMFVEAMNQHVEEPESLHGPLFGVSDFNVFHQMLRSAGFRDTSVTELDIVWQITSIESYLDAFRAWANLGSLPAPTRTAVENAVREKATELESVGKLNVSNPGHPDFRDEVIRSAGRK